MFEYRVSKSNSQENIPLLLQDSEEHDVQGHLVVKSDSEVEKEKFFISEENEIDELVIEEDFYHYVEISKFQGVIHIIKCSVGTGILAMPSTLKYSGYLVGMISILVLTSISVYCMHLLIEVVEYIRSLHLDQALNLDYERTVKLCFEHSTTTLRKFVWMRYLLLGALTVAQIGFLSSYHIFVAENTKSLVDYYVDDHEKELPLWGYLLIYFFLLNPLLFFKTLDKLTYICHLANVLMVLSLIISLVYCYINPLPISQLKAANLSESTLLSFGIIIFSAESINLLNSVENNLRNKKDMKKLFGVINLAFSFIIPLSILVGFSGYLGFGENVSSSIILSIPMQPWYFMLCKPFYIISIFISYSLQGYVLFIVLWKKINPLIESEKSKKICEIILRISIGLSTTSLSILIPYFDLVISLIGAFSGASILMLFPSICNFVMVYSTRQNKHWKLKLAVDVVIFFIGIIGGALGTYSTIIAINNKSRNSSTFN